MALSVDIEKQLGDFTLSVRFEAENECLALLGASGCGKSVTLRCIAGILTPDKGKIVLDGVTLFDSTAQIDLPPQKRQVGYLFQQYALFPNMTVRQNIAAAVRDKQRRKAVTEEKLRQFRLEEVADKLPGQISGGQQQRTALARILASEPKTILLDEPFSALDSYLKYQLEVELAETLEQFPGTILWVSHDRGEVFRNCRRVCVLDQGISQGTFTLRELFHQPVTEAAARLSGCKNYADAVPMGNAVSLPEWGLILNCGKEVPADIRRIGIRAHHVTIAEPQSPGSFPCAVQRVIQDVFITIVLLRPEGAAPDAPPLRMELDREDWYAVEDKQHVWAAIQPRDILLLK
ncbi:sulfate/molybdate ABC transporter ATP-binding protein [Oscillibacter sp.]|uniref:sulfate/molybdate ABC transporter ATP-binding protein n=1 Tax=Oscillibacter sp. TaxID=1945593 RepID=UPI001B4A01EC|nr:ATP-binding cassette domain-containing protein [Oscillibacter sp.]MBP3510222.1 ATP-binding cassette domain-containing protein [Oscillibacter sp.]